MQLILILAIFYSPYIKSFEKDENSANLHIFIKDKKCGFLNISNTKLTYTYSCGMNIGKGGIDVDNVILKYENDKLILSSSEHPRKKLLKFKCERTVYDKAYVYLLEAKKNFSRKNQENNKRKLFN